MDENVVNLSSCKSCDFQLNSNLNFCPSCGGKIIKNRLTVKSVFILFVQNVFNFDNKFTTTLKDLIVKPEVVFKSFIEGARKKYYHPISLLAIAIVLNSIMINLYPFEEMEMDEGFRKKSYEIGFKSAGGTEEEFKEKLKDEKVRKKIEDADKRSAKTQKEINDFVKGNTTLLSYLNIPVYALIAFLVFWKRKEYNFAEIITVVLYQNSLTTFLSVLVIPILYFADSGSGTLYLVSILAVFLYSNYSFQRLFKLNLKQIIFANIRFLFISLTILIVFVILISAVMIALQFQSFFK